MPTIRNGQDGQTSTVVPMEIRHAAAHTLRFLLSCSYVSAQKKHSNVCSVPPFSYIDKKGIMYFFNVDLFTVRKSQ
jgi:hypothetical protein